MTESHFSIFWVFKEYPQKSQIGKIETSRNQGTWLGIPWLGLVSLCQIWDFCGISLNILKYPILGISYFFLWHLTKLLFKETFPHSGRIWYYCTTMSTKDQICFFLIVHDLKETKQLLYLIPKLQRQFVFSLHTQVQIIDIQPVPVLNQW